MKRYKWPLLAILVLLVSGGGVYRLWSGKLSANARPNILIISACSLRYDLLSAYDNVDDVLPNLNRFAEKSFVVSDPINENSWGSVVGHLFGIDKKLLDNHGYRAIGQAWNQEQIYEQSPWGIDLARSAAFHVDDRYNPLMQDEFSSIKKKMADETQWPFLLQIHMRNLHFPYGRVLFEDSPLRELSPEDQRYLKEYSGNVLRYPDRLALGLLLGTVKKDIKRLILKSGYGKALENVDEKSLRFAGLLNNPTVIKNWKGSSFYKTDLALIKKIYVNKARIFDRKLKILLDFLEQEKMEKSTVVIFAGDHGEAFGEHGSFIHGEKVNEEMIKFPLFIKFPGQTEMKPLNFQFNQKSILPLVKAIIGGEIGEEKFQGFFSTKLSSKYIVSKNCANNLFSVRTNTEWKFIMDFKDGKKYLFSLKGGRNEANNLIDSNVGLAYELEDYLMDHLDVNNTKMPWTGCL